MDTIRIGTRGSQLAVTQTELVLGAIQETFPNAKVETVTIKTTGDKRQGTPEAGTLDKKAWVRELESAILDESIELAIHSGKDVPFNIEEGTELLPVLTRARPADCFIGRLKEDGSRLTFDEVPQNSKVGTASLRRRASLLRLRPDLEVVEHRGNVPTRIRKLDENPELAGIVLACAGIDRLKDVNVDLEAFDMEDFLPALAQGTLVAQFKSTREDIAQVLKQISDPTCVALYQAERACAARLEVDCHSVLGVLATKDEQEVSLHARVIAADGVEAIEARRSAKMGKQMELLGIQTAEELLSKGADRLLHLD